MIYLLFYDITDDKIRTKVAKLLIAEGFERLQLSVYTGLENPVKNKNLWDSLKKLLSIEPEAKLYVIKMTKKNFKRMDIIGNFASDMDYLTGEKRSLII